MVMAERPNPAAGIALTHFVVASDVERSRAFYTDVLGGETVESGHPSIVALANSWIIINLGGGPTPDKPDVVLEEDDLKSVCLIRTGVGALLREGTPLLKVVHDTGSANAKGASTGNASLLDEIVRDGARQMLAAALQAEVAAYIEAHRHEVDEDGHRAVVRNGYHAEREVTTAAGGGGGGRPPGDPKRH